ncbi:MAG TPA: hypothetical protein VNR65_11690 [Geobacterales bacterium]|nr:hypothetical protein [Geobacterales bacterium]
MHTLNAMPRGVSALSEKQMRAFRLSDWCCDDRCTLEYGGATRGFRAARQAIPDVRIYSVVAMPKSLCCTAVVTGPRFVLRELGKYAIYGAMLSGFALPTLVPKAERANAPARAARVHLNADKLL